jgi:CRP/FNR family transcriptional regulator
MEHELVLNDDIFARIMSIMPNLRHADTELRREFREVAYYAQIPAGSEIFGYGDRVNAIALIMSGAIRVYKVGETGREITLYRFSSGESCILTANAILNNQVFSAIATVEQDAEAIMVPAETFRNWVDRFSIWREFVFDLLSQRLATVMEIIEEVAFGRMDIRVVNFLLEHGRSQNPIQITHQEIAAELGSSREVISRLLGNLADHGFLDMERGSIQLLNIEALKAHTLR